MKQASDIRSHLASAEHELREAHKEAKNPVAQAAKRYGPEWEKSYEEGRLTHLKDRVGDLQKQSDFVSKARSAHETGRSPLSTTMSTKIVKGK